MGGVLSVQGTGLSVQGIGDVGARPGVRENGIVGVRCGVHLRGVRLEVTRKSDLAVRALVELGTDRPEGSLPVKGADLADRVSTSGGFLAQVMTPLVKAGWVRSDPGPSGGYSLVADLGKVSVLAVIEQIEGPTDNGQCVLVDRPCNESGQCALHSAWMRARTEILDELARLSVAEAQSMSAIIPRS